MYPRFQGHRRLRSVLKAQFRWADLIWLWVAKLHYAVYPHYANVINSHQNYSTSHKGEKAIIFKLSQIQTITLPEKKADSTQTFCKDHGGGGFFGLKKKKVVTCHGSGCKEIHTSHVSTFISQKQFAVSINRKIDRREGNVSEETRFGTLSQVRK